MAAQAQPVLLSSPQPTRLQSWLRVADDTKPRVYAFVSTSAELTSLSYWLEIFFSAAIATFGLVLNSPAVIIGAMLISPLMGPILATGMALAVGDLYLAVRAIANLVASISLSVGLSAFLVWVLPFHSPTAEVLARTKPNLLDLGVAIFSGLAGSLVISRTGGAAAGVAALPGVAIAVALMPPLCTVGFGLGSEGGRQIVVGAGLLFLTNLVAIVSSAFLVFSLVGMTTPAVRTQMQLIQRDNFLSKRLSTGVLARAFGEGGKLRWRILLLLVLLATIAVPLKRALTQVASDTLARSEVGMAIRKLAPEGSLLSHDVTINQDNIAVHLISTTSVPPARIRQAQQQLAARTHRQVALTLQEVASKGELADLMSRLNTPAAPPAPAPPPPPESVTDVAQDLYGRVAPVVRAVWPAGVPVQTLTVALSSAGAACDVTYLAAKPLDAISLGLITRELQERLNDPGLVLTATLQKPPQTRHHRRGR